MADYYAYHNDQGIVHDMSIADIHFVPHSADLSGTGVARLERLAELLADAGGTVYYDTAMADRELVDRRLETAHAFLAECRAGRHEVAVALGAAGGPGMGFREAVAGAAIAQQPEKRERAYDFSKIGQTTGGR
jgi:hypothetical protein